MRGTALKRTVESMFTVIKDRSTSEEVCFICPHPGCTDQTGNRSVNLKNGKTGCWICNKGGDFVVWARHLGYEVSDEAVQQAVPLDEIDVSASHNEATPLPLVREVRLPKGFTYCHNRPRDIYTQLIAEMAETKRLSIEDLFEARVGFTKDDPKWEPYAIFPVTEHDRVIYWQGRTYVDVPGESTKRFPGRDEVPNGAKYWIYNIDELRRSASPIALVMESILNVLSMRRFFRENGIDGITPVCVFKHYLSKPQARKLRQISTLKEICLLYDHDATRSSWEKAPLVSGLQAVTVAEMPPGPGGEKNDPNDDPAAAWASFEARERSNILTSIRFIGAPRAVSKPRPTLARVPASPLDSLNL